MHSFFTPPEDALREVEAEVEALRGRPRRAVGKAEPAFPKVAELNTGPVIIRLEASWGL
jgi:hypothetical protein